MYDELVKRLRALAGGGREEKCDGCPYDEDYPRCVDCLDKLHKQAADAIEALSKLVLDEHNRAAVAAWEPRWIPAAERLPEQGKRYLVIRFDEVSKTQFIDILWHDAHDLWWNRLYKGQYNVTHWMPLPEPPKEKT